jgi:hypothetical protein
MTKFLTVLAAGSALALTSVAAPTPADARCWGCGVAAGVIGGIAAGAIIAGATRPAYGYYGYGPAYAYDPGYAYAPAYDGGYYGYGYGYGYPRYGGATSDYTNRDRQLQGTR